MEDLTDFLLKNDGSYEYVEDLPEVQADPAMNITVAMLNRRPEIKRVLLDQLSEFIVEWDNLQSATGTDTEMTEEEKREKVESFTDEQLVNALNSDPFVQGAVIECLTELSDCIDNEGEPNYTPSIFDTDDVNQLKEHAAYGLREDGDNEFIPAKYSDLSEECVSLIYGNPDCRKLVSKFRGPLTDKVVNALFKTATLNKL
jgi:hypothetical protein